LNAKVTKSEKEKEWYKEAKEKESAELQIIIMGRETRDPLLLQQVKEDALWQRTAAKGLVVQAGCVDVQSKQRRKERGFKGGWRGGGVLQVSKINSPRVHKSRAPSHLGD
jgi:hypothetical protein